MLSFQRRLRLSRKVDECKPLLPTPPHPEQGDGKEHTVEQMGGMRHILINAARDAALKHAHMLASCGQCEDGCAMFDTSNGNEVVGTLTHSVGVCLVYVVWTPAETAKLPWSHWSHQALVVST